VIAECFSFAPQILNTGILYRTRVFHVLRQQNFHSVPVPTFPQRDLNHQPRRLAPITSSLCESGQGDVPKRNEGRLSCDVRPQKKNVSKPVRSPPIFRTCNTALATTGIPTLFPKEATPRVIGGRHGRLDLVLPGEAKAVRSLS
jgi:hypothetical protein